MKLLTNIVKKKPSPTYASNQSDPAQDPDKSIKHKMHISPKRTSQPAPRTFLQGSMSVEAAIVLPICILFLLNLGYSLELIRLHNRLQLALYEVGTNASVYGCDLGDGMIATIAADLYIQNGLIQFCGEDYLQASPLPQGSKSLSFMESGFLGEDRLDIKLTYRISPFCALAGFESFRMSNRFVTHLWNGYNIPENASEQGVVYIAEYGSVYHTDRSCAHLRVDRREVNTADLAQLRNANGARYGKCLMCAVGEAPSKVYITSEGDSYHYSAQCRALRRTVRTVPAGEAVGYSLCERCGKQ